MLFLANTSLRASDAWIEIEAGPYNIGDVKKWIQEVWTTVNRHDDVTSQYPETIPASNSLILDKLQPDSAQAASSSQEIIEVHQSLADQEGADNLDSENAPTPPQTDDEEFEIEALPEELLYDISSYLDWNDFCLSPQPILVF